MEGNKPRKINPETGQWLEVEITDVIRDLVHKGSSEVIENSDIEETTKKILEMVKNAK